jgi:hypothetical protein
MTISRWKQQQGIDAELGVDAGQDLVDTFQVRLSAAIKKAQRNFDDQGQPVADAGGIDHVLDMRIQVGAHHGRRHVGGVGQR